MRALRSWRLRTRSAAVCAAAACAALALAAYAGEHDSVLWGYSGDGAPEHWAKLSPAWKACASGQSQSPVDIVDPAKAELPPLEVSYDWKIASVAHSGHAIQVNPEPGSALIAGGKRFELEEFHFHTPSENRVGGVSYPLEVHFEHRAADGSRAVLAVFFKEGASNASVGKIASTAPWSEDQIAAPRLRLSERELLPADRSYYLYSGSLTMPPCTENVRWFVLAQPLEVSAAQVLAFEQIVGRNARPLQPLHTRLVLR